MNVSGPFIETYGICFFLLFLPLATTALFVFFPENYNADEEMYEYCD